VAVVDKLNKPLAEFSAQNTQASRDLAVAIQDLRKAYLDNVSPVPLPAVTTRDTKAGPATLGGVQEAQVPVVTVYLKIGSCIPCDNFLADTKDVGDLPFQFNWVSGPDPWGYAASRGYPLFVWVNPTTGIQDSTTGWSGLAAFKRRYTQRPLQMSATSPIQLQYVAPQVYYTQPRATTLYYRSGRSRWSWPGDLRTHLYQTHRVNVSGWSDDQCIQYHDSYHDRHGRRSMKKAAEYAAKAQYHDEKAARGPGPVKRFFGAVVTLGAYDGSRHSVKHQRKAAKHQSKSMMYGARASSQRVWVGVAGCPTCGG
jgi:hypothetical protein